MSSVIHSSQLLTTGIAEEANSSLGAASSPSLAHPPSSVHLASAVAIPSVAAALLVLIGVVGGVLWRRGRGEGKGSSQPASVLRTETDVAWDSLSLHFVDAQGSSFPAKVRLLFFGHQMTREGAH